MSSFEDEILNICLRETDGYIATTQAKNIAISIKYFVHQAIEKQRTEIIRSNSLLNKRDIHDVFINGMLESLKNLEIELRLDK